MNDSIQQFGIPESNREETISDSRSPHLILLYSPIFSALKLNTSITELDLSYWKVFDLFPCFADVITLNNTITDLCLAGCPITSEVMNGIRMNSSVETLDLRYCCCDNSVFENTRGTSLNLTNLDISGNRFNFTQVAEWLKYSVNLTSLKLSGSQISGNERDAFCEWFPKRSKLTKLKIIDGK
eukprot:TRINITY_DN7853_c0_g1_i1.p1 TRINITY_DN7853_c0_g1~~TRINITY_DN7853_c0_g1_i1.p1  ORF type:complete len:201 (-),score=20.11 TRINITY_DN7853_c0_g1_i1:248-796(-)